VKLAREMQADYEIDDFDVAQVERTAEDRRGFEAVDLARGWDQALVFGLRWPAWRAGSGPGRWPC
jgi:hypothetical protein